VGGRGYWGWENARSCFALARAAELADDPTVGQWVEDATADGSDEQLLCDGRELVILSAHGARVLYWFDLQAGQQWIGNQLAVPAATFTNDAAKTPQTKPDLRRWLPDSYEASLKGWQGSRQKEPAPTRMGRYLPEGIFERDAAELTVYRSPLDPAYRHMPLLAQAGAFGDAVRVDAKPEQRFDDVQDYRFEPAGLTYMSYPLPKLVIEKRMSHKPDRLTARYRITNRDVTAHQLWLRSIHELAPDYAAALGQGRRAFTYYLHEDRFPAVRNNLTGVALALASSVPAQRADCVVNLLALQVELNFSWRLEPGAEQEFEIELRRIEPGAH
jgi:hypothetical protein